ncbi:ATP-binding protein (plasmid) [Streptomyces sp. BHT-5-2]|uniref:sensor histidine kinase n=1 Tax=unclassified Streptomyces TaxID=2593676 RepID=UPI001C8DB3B1|nr:ATP-binding protein [Streptomyces sp. BHT-5-2]QZL07136.1 ATP-binding protein [Streptomyces sp. BHT-5-2]
MPTAIPQRTETSRETSRSHGGRHGRVAAFPEPVSDAAIRSRLVRIAAVPALLVAVVCAGVAAFVVRSGGARLTSREWAVLAGGLAAVCAIVLIGALVGSSEARALAHRCGRLREVCARARTDLADLLDRVRNDEWLRPGEEREPLPEPGGDSLTRLAHEVAATGRAAEAALIEAVGIVRSDATGNQQKLEVFVNLARRLQSLVHRQILTLDEMEHQVEDPDLLKGLFVIDHLATRIRRHAENLAVLGGAITRRQWTRPITMTEVVRSSTAEVEQYTRIKLVSPFEGTLRGHAVADVVHLLAELVENATEFSDPETPVTVRARHVTAGLAVEVEDRGLGMPAEEQEQMNRLLTDPERIDLTELLDDGRIGLYVVSSLAQRHGLLVRLQGSIYGGVQAVVIVPPELLGANSAETREEFPDGMEDEEGEPAPGRGRRPHGDRFDDVPERREVTAGPAPSGAPAPARALPAGSDAVPARRRIVRTPASATAASVQAAVTAPQHASGTPHGPSRGGHPADPGPVVLPPPPLPLDDTDRPSLPRRVKQSHLAPQLRDGPVRPPDRAGPERLHDPNLMAAYQRGFSRGDPNYAAGLAATGHPASAPAPTPGRRGGTGSPGDPEPHPVPDHDAPMARPRGDDPDHGE